MPQYIAVGLPYQEAIALIDRLKASEIEANITVGGVALHLSPDRINEAEEICKEMGASFKAGFSMQQENRARLSPPSAQQGGAG